MDTKAALLVEGVPSIEERDGLFYITVNLGSEALVFVARPHTFLAGAKLACDLGHGFMADQCEPLRLAG